MLLLSLRLLFGLISLLSSSAQAARPMVIDDARVVDAKSCQLESWLKATENRQEFWALPACNFTENTEVTLGGAKLKDGDQQDQNNVFQIKHLLKAMQHGHSGYAWSLGNVHYRLDKQAQSGDDVYATLISSHPYYSDHLILHTNLGLLRADQNNQYRTTWGLGAEYQLKTDLWMMGEIYGQRTSVPSYQVGLRYWLIDQRFQLDTTFGSTTDHAESWISLGVRLLSVPFLP